MLWGMSIPSQRRSRPDRRSSVRGGRRPHDKPGSAPLVLVVGNGSDPQQESETILARLRFAVAPAASVPEALRVAQSLHPDLIVARPEEARRLRAEGSVDIPIVEYDGAGPADTTLVDLLREAIRNRRT
jgi:hypothetical protein